VTPEGKYVKPPRKEMSYGALIGTRAQLVRAPTPHHFSPSIISLGSPLLRMCKETISEPWIPSPLPLSVIWLWHRSRRRWTSRRRR
jgi:hypothetical protein